MTRRQCPPRRAAVAACRLAWIRQLTVTISGRAPVMRQPGDRQLEGCLSVPDFAPPRAGLSLLFVMGEAVAGRGEMSSDVGTRLNDGPEILRPDRCYGVVAEA